MESETKNELITGAEQFEEISVCPHCNEPAEEKFSGDEGWTFCSGECGCIEGEGSVHKFICKKCEQICDEEKCECGGSN
jgi:hypothetical protein